MPELGKPSGQRSQINSGVLNVVQLLLRGLGAAEVMEGLLVYQVDVGARLLDAHSGSEPRDHVQRLEELVVQSVPTRRDLFLHRQGYPYVRGIAHRGAEELRRSHANDGIDGRSDSQFLADDGRIAPKPPLPPGIAGDRDGTAAGRLVV